MIYCFIEDHRSLFRVEKMCQVLGVSRSGYYAYRKRPPSARERDNRRLLARIRIIFQKNHKVYGSPRITMALHEEGWNCGENRVARLMRRHGIRAKSKRKFKVTTHSQHTLPVAPNLLRDKELLPDGPGQVWAGDITYIPTQEGWLYLAVVVDMWSRRIVGWAARAWITADLVKEALTKAIYRHAPGKGCIHHSDRGIQYASSSYQELLQDHGFRCSMSRKGNCYDNALVESLFKTLKTELVYHTTYHTREGARRSLFEYIESFYNHLRLHSSLGYMSPSAFERIFSNVA